MADLGRQYAHTVVEGEKMTDDFGNRFYVVSRRPYKGNPEKGLAPGLTLTLQILEDHSEPRFDKQGNQLDNHVFDTFDVTIVGCTEDVKKGDLVALEGFLPEHSYYIDFNLILRFSGIKKLQKQTAGQVGQQGTNEGRKQA